MNEPAEPALSNTSLAPDIIIYGKDGCPYCTQAKATLDRAGKPYLYAALDNTDQRTEFYDRHQLVGRERTMPQIFVRGERIGGYTDLIVHLTSEPV